MNEAISLWEDKGLQQQKYTSEIFRFNTNVTDEIWSGTVAVGGDAAEGSDIQVCSANHSVWIME